MRTNAVTTAVAKHLTFTQTVLPWIAAMGAIWLISASIYRTYEAIDIETSPRMRALGQKYLFVYMLGHSPRYFQENFAGKLGQKVKQAGQATVSILNILCLDMTRVTVLVFVGGVLMFEAHASYALILAVWTALYLVSSCRWRGVACGFRKPSPTKSPPRRAASSTPSPMPISCAPSPRLPTSAVSSPSSWKTR